MDFDDFLVGGCVTLFILGFLLMIIFGIYAIVEPKINNNTITNEKCICEN